MKILPVLDLLEGVVVRGVAGQRNQYRPVQSRLAADSQALTVARAFRSELGLSELYLADLDAILDRRPNLDLYRSLVDDGFQLLLDAGLRNLQEASVLLRTGVQTLVAGLETIPGPDFLRELCAEWGDNRVVFSLDMQQGKPLGNLENWQGERLIHLAQEAVENGINRLIVLDLAQVGMQQGVDTLKLCRQLKDQWPHLQLITGGGVKGVDDLIALQQKEIDGVLVASALHNGLIQCRDIEQLTTQ